MADPTDTTFHPPRRAHVFRRLSLSAGGTLVALAAWSACNRTSDSLQGGQDEALLARGADNRASSYKDPQPPRTSPPPAAAGSDEPDAGAAPVISGRTRHETSEGLSFQVPVEWTRVPGTDESGEAAFVIPGPGGAGQLRVYAWNFPGADDAEYEKWRQRFSQDTQPRTGEEDVRAMIRGPLQITRVDVADARLARWLPVEGRAGQRVLAALVEGAEGPHTRVLFVASGPPATLSLWEQSFADFTATFALDTVS